MEMDAAALADAMTTALNNSGLKQSIDNLTSATNSLESKIVSSAGNQSNNQQAPGSTPAPGPPPSDINSQGSQNNNQINQNAEALRDYAETVEESNSVSSNFLNTIMSIGDTAVKAAVKMSSFITEVNRLGRAQTDTVVELDRNIQEAFGNVRFAQFSSSAIGKSVQNLFVTSLKEVTDISTELRDTAEENIVNIRGRTESALSFLFGYGEKGQEALLRAQNAFLQEGKASTELFFADLETTAVNRSIAVGKALDISAADQAALVDITIERTGKASTDLIEEVGAFSLKIQETTGANIKKVADGVTSLIKDVETFGDIGVDSAARITGALINLGVEMESFSGLVTKFMNFDSAVSSIGDLTSAFGLQLDAMELFQLANEDEEEFMKRIREEFQSQGIAVEDLNKAQLSLLKTNLGFSSVGDVKNFLREGSAGFEELASATDEVDVASSFEDIVAQGKDAAVTMRDLDEALKSNEMFRTADQARTLAASLDEATLSAGKFLEGTSRPFREITTQLGYMSTQFLIDNANEVMQGNFSQVAQNMENLINDIGNRLTTFVSSALNNIGAGVLNNETRTSFINFFSIDNLLPPGSFLRSGSLSPFGKEILKGITDSALLEGISLALDEAFRAGFDKIMLAYDDQFEPALIDKFKSFEETIKSQVMKPGQDLLRELVDTSLQESTQNVSDALQRAQTVVVKSAIESVDLGVETTGASITATAIPITEAVGQLKETADNSFNIQQQIVNNGNLLLTAMSQLIEGVSGLNDNLGNSSNIENRTVLNLDGRVVAEIVNNNSYNPNTGQTVLITNENDLQ